MTPRTALPFLLGLGAVALAAPARADGVAYDALPEARIAPPPAAAAFPARVAAGEHVDGFFLAHPPKGQWTAGKPTYAHVFTTEAAARAFGSGAQPLGEDAPGPHACVTATSAQQIGDSPAWPASFEQRATLSIPRAMMAMLPESVARSVPTAVWAVHAERLAVAADGASASLETTDFFADAESLGARLLGHAQTTFRKIADGPEGVRVFAARAEDGAVEIVMTPGEGSSKNKMARLLTQRLVAQFDGDEEDASGQSDCGHLRVRLAAGEGEGAMAVFQNDVVLPPLDADAPPPTANDQPNDAMEMLGDRVRVRPLRTFVSETRAARDARPFLSVSFGWGGKERGPGI